MDTEDIYNSFSSTGLPSLGAGFLLGGESEKPKSSYDDLLSHFDALTDQLLSKDYAGGNATQAWQNEDLGKQKTRDISPAAFFAQTGRIDGRAPQAKVKSGLQSGTLTGGTSITPQADWDAQFKPSLPKEGNGKGLTSIPFQNPLQPKPPGLITSVGKFGTQYGRGGTSGTSISSPYGVASVRSGIEADQSLASKIRLRGGVLAAPDLANQIFS